MSKSAKKGLKRRMSGRRRAKRRNGVGRSVRATERTAVHGKGVQNRFDVPFYERKARDPEVPFELREHIPLPRAG